MKKFCLMTLTLIVVLTLVSPVAASGPTGTIGIYSVAACQDTTTVAVSGTASAATNRIKAWIYKPNDKGEWIQLANTVTANFTSGSFMMPLVLDYFGNSVKGGTPLQVVVKLQSLSGNSFVDVSSTSTIVNASDKSSSKQMLGDDQFHRQGPRRRSDHRAQPLRIVLPAGRLAAQRHVHQGRSATFLLGGGLAVQLDDTGVVLPGDRKRSHAQNAARAVLAE